MKTPVKIIITLRKVTMNDAALIDPASVGSAKPLHLSSKQHPASHFVTVIPGIVWLQTDS